MKIKITYFGKIKNKNLLEEINELKKRIKRIELYELKEIKDSNSNNQKDKECKKILENLNEEDFNILLTESGKSYTTNDFANFVLKKQKTINFIISGPFGPSDKLRTIIKEHLSLSKMIFTHEQALYMLIEQIYRVSCIQSNISYTK